MDAQDVQADRRLLFYPGRQPGTELVYMTASNGPAAQTDESRANYYIANPLVVKTNPTFTKRYIYAGALFNFNKAPLLVTCSWNGSIVFQGFINGCWTPNIHYGNGDIKGDNVFSMGADQTGGSVGIMAQVAYDAPGTDTQVLAVSPLTAIPISLVCDTITAVMPASKAGVSNDPAVDNKGRAILLACLSTTGEI